MHCAPATADPPESARQFIALTFPHLRSLPQLKMSENGKCGELWGNGSKIDTACDLMHVAGLFKNVNVITF